MRRERPQNVSPRALAADGVCCWQASGGQGGGAPACPSDSWNRLTQMCHVPCRAPSCTVSARLEASMAAIDEMVREVTQELFLEAAVADVMGE